jgi:hypothetical protein
MAKITKVSEADLKKRILAVEADRLKNPSELRPDRAARSRLEKHRAAAESMMARWMTGAGLDIDKLRSAHEAREAELGRLVEAHKRDALGQAAKLRNKLHLGVAGQVKAFSDLAKKPDFFPHPTFTLDTPFLIWSNPLLELDSQAAPFDSWAKFNYKTSQYQGTQKVSFYFYWANPFSDFAVINATTFMSASGHLRSHAPWGFWVNTSWVDAYARFGLWFGVPREVNPVGYEEQWLAATGAYGSATTGGETNSTSVSAGLQLSKTMFAVPPSTVVVFEVALAVNFENDDGDIEADFNSGDFRIACPLIVFSLLNSPPGIVISP